MLTLKDYYQGRDVQFAPELTREIQANAAETLHRVNLLLLDFYRANPRAAIRSVNSGWRPVAVNRGVQNAAQRSHHLTAKACDLSDDDGNLDRWLLTNAGQSSLVRIELWMEDPTATPRWCHVQIVAPKSGRRVFLPGGQWSVVGGRLAAAAASPRERRLKAD